jgi:hypothetical protein
MPKWTQLPSEPLLFNPYQSAFWAARRKRLCKTCEIEFDCPPNFCCPQCQGTDRSQNMKRAFHRLALVSGRRGGKTKGASIAVAEEATVPNSIVWACAPTNPKLHRYVIPAFQQIIPDSWVHSYSSEFNDLRLKNGSLIHFQTLEDPDQGRGQGLDCVWIDEASELTEDHWHVLRPSLTERRGSAIISTSPRSFDWVWKEFYNKAELTIPGYWACRYKTSENPIISEEEIADAKATMPETMFQQEYEADFVIFEGAVYGGNLDSQILSDNVKIREVLPEWSGHPSSIAPWRQVVVGIDTGADHPFGAVKLVSTEKGLVVVGEYLERHKAFVEHANEMKRLAGNPNVKWAINKNERQPMIELAQHGIFCNPAENDVVSGTERVKSWLHVKQLWFIEPYCPRTVKQLKSYRWAPDKTKDGQVRQEKVFKRDDELPDCLRYAVMTWPRLPEAPPDPGPQQRSIANLPEKMQQDILRMRKLEKHLKDSREPETVTGDFWS